MSTSSKLFAFLAYLLLIVGWLIVFLFRREDKLAMYHTKQSVTLTLVAILVPLVWVIGGWTISLIPYLGFIMAIAFYSLVIALEISLAVSAIVGLIYAWQGKMKPIPIVGSWAERLFA